MARLRTILSAAAALLAAAACCANGQCIKDPPCRCGENPCCLTPIQKTALKGGTHALPGPLVYTFNNHTIFLFTEKGQKDFEKDPSKFDEMGATRLIRGGKTWRVDTDPGEGFDWRGEAARAVPYNAPPPSK